MQVQFSSQWFRKFVAAAAVWCLAAGGGLITAGLLGVAGLNHFLAGSALVKLATALVFVLLGVGLWLRRSPGTSAWRTRAVSVAGIGVMGIAALMLVQHPFPHFPGVYRLAHSWRGTQSGLMPFPVIASFFALGAASVLNAVRRRLFAAQALVLFAAITVLVDYTCHLPGSQLTAASPSVGTFTAGTILLLSVAVLALEPQRGLFGLAARPTGGGIFVRRVFPAAIGLPIVLGWLRLEGERLGFYPGEFGIEVSVIWFVLVISASVVWTAYVLERDERQRRQLEDTLRESEQRFRAIADTAPATIWMTDADGQCTYLNRRWLELRGRTPEQELGEAWHDALHPDDRERYLQAGGAALAERREFTAETRVRRADGQYRWVFTTGLPRFTADGTYLGLVGSAIDITDRKRAEDALRESEARYRTLTENAYDLIAELTPEGQAVYISPNHREVMGYAPEELVGYNVLDWVHPEDRPNIAAASEQGFANLVYRFRCKDGCWRWFEGTGRLFRTAAGPQHVVVISRDITGRRQAQEALELSEMRLRLAVDAANLGLWDWTVTADDRIYMSPRWKHQLGYEDDEFANTIDEWVLRLHPKDAPRALEALRACFAGESPDYRGHFRLRHKDGSYRWIASRGRMVPDPSGRPSRMLGLHMDVTRRRRTQRAIRDSEQRYRMLVELSPDPIWLHADERLIYVNPAGLKLLGVSHADDILGRPAADFVHPDSCAAVRQRWEQLRRGVPVPIISTKVVSCDGTVHLIESAATGLRYRGRPAILVFGRDLTERQRAEEELQRSAERLQTLSRRLLEVQENERRTLARELHDQIAQSLTAVRIDLQRRQSLLAARAIASDLEDSIAVVDEAIQQVRTLSLDLRPSMLDDLGLIPALRWYIDRQAGRAGLTAQLSASTRRTKLPSAVESACFRIVQDALTNVMQHAHAHHVHVELHCRDARLHVSVRDDGVGFNVARQRARAARGKSMGLLSMQERAALLGGRLEIHSERARGTQVSAWFPLEAAPQPQPPADAGLSP